MHKIHSNAFLKRRRFLMVLPLLLIPFITFAFWALGGGKTGAGQTVYAKGLNPKLPDAVFVDTSMAGKMSMYAAAEEKEAVLRRKGMLSADPQVPTELPGASLPLEIGVSRTARPGGTESAIQEKLNKIQLEISRPAEQPARSAMIVKPAGQEISTDVDRLETLMKSIRSEKEEDPEISQLQLLMDKILEVQQPGRTTVIQQKPNSDSTFQAIPAEIAMTAKVTQGAVVKLRLLDSAVVGGIRLQKGQELFGMAELANQRLLVQIRNIRRENSIVPVNLTVFDRRDAMPGIEAPEALIKDALRTGGNDVVGTIGLSTFDTGLGTQLAGAGLDAAKSVFRNKVKRIKVKLRAGYPVLLRNNELKRP